MHVEQLLSSSCPRKMVFGYPDEEANALVVDIDVAMACCLNSRATTSLAEH